MSLGRKARRRLGGRAAHVAGRLDYGLALHVKAVVGEDIGNGRQAVVGLCGGHVMDMAHLAQTAWTVLRVATIWLISRSKASESLIDGCRLDDSVARELGGGRSSNRETWRWTFPFGCGWRPCLHSKESRILCSWCCITLVYATWLRAFLPGLYNLSLLVSHIEAPL